MVAGANSGADDFQSFLNQYWSLWKGGTERAGQSSGSVPEGFQQWARLMSVDAPAGLAETLQRLCQPDGDWFRLMHQVASRFAGQDTSAAEVAAAWRAAVLDREHDLLKVFLDAGKAGVAWMDHPAMQELSKAFGGMQALDHPWLQMPAFGPAREHQSRWQALLKAQREHQQRMESYQRQLRTVLDDAFALFEARLAQHETPETQLGSARALFDLWIEVAEEAYAKVALSEDFQQVYGELANAHMRFHAAAQAEVDQVCRAAGIPTREEMDAAHRKIAELERALRKLMRTGTPAAPPAAPTAVKKAAAKKATVKKRAAAKKGAVTRKSAVGKKPEAAKPPRPRAGRTKSP